MNFIKDNWLAITAIGILIGLCGQAYISLDTAIIVGIALIFFMRLDDKMENGFMPVKNALCEIQLWLNRNFDFVPTTPMGANDYFKAKSPIDLTDVGEKLLEESGAKDVVDKQYHKLSQMLDSKEPQTAFDVQEYAGKVIAELDDTDAFIPIKRFIYNNPEFHGRTLTIMNVEQVMAIYLRNKYLAQHSELLSDAADNK